MRVALQPFVCMISVVAFCFFFALARGVNGIEQPADQRNQGNVGASVQIPAFRALQYDLEGESRGSRRAKIDLRAIVDPLSSSIAGKKRMPRKKRLLNRYVALVTMDDITVEHLEELVDELRLGGLLLVIPRDFSAVSAERMAEWLAVEQWLLSREIKIPIYFARDSPEVAELHGSLVAARRSASGWDYYKLKSDVSDGSKLVRPSLHNIQGWLPGSSAEMDSESLPTILVVAHYDTFGAAPDLATGSGSNSGGVVALLELARLFSQLYDEDASRGNYNLLFILTGGGHTNFAGAREWLAVVDEQLLQSIDFALCLDTIVGASEEGDGLYLHFSKSPKHPTIQRLRDTFKSVAGDMQVPFHMVRKKINLTDPILAWEHEQFALKHVVSATVSSRPTPPSLFQRSSIFDVRRRGHEATLVRNIRLIAEALASYMYPALQGVGESVDGSAGLRVFDGSMGVDANFAASWGEYLDRTPRVAPFLPAKDPLFDTLERALSARVDLTTNQEFPLERHALTPFEFYSSTQGTLSAFICKETKFDLALMFCAVTYVLTLYFGLTYAVHGKRHFVSNLPGWMQGLCGRRRK